MVQVALGGLLAALGYGLGAGIAALAGRTAPRSPAWRRAWAGAAGAAWAGAAAMTAAAMDWQRQQSESLGLPPTSPAWWAALVGSIAVAAVLLLAARSLRGLARGRRPTHRAAAAAGPPGPGRRPQRPRWSPVSSWAGSPPPRRCSGTSTPRSSLPHRRPRCGRAGRVRWCRGTRWGPRAARSSSAGPRPRRSTRSPDVPPSSRSGSSPGSPAHRPRSSARIWSWRSWTAPTGSTARSSSRWSRPATGSSTRLSPTRRST